MRLWERPVMEARPLRVLGRTDEQGGALRLRWAMSGAQVRIRCAQLYVELEAEYEQQAIWAAVLVDGAPVSRFALTPGRRWYAALLGMDADVAHTVSIVRETQPVDAEPRARLLLHALRSDGELLPLPEPGLTVEFIGDSLTSGEGLAGAVGTMEWRTAFLSASRTYAQTLLGILGAQGRWVSMCGWGVTYAWDGNRAHSVPGIYTQLCGPEADGGAPYGFDANPAGLVIVNLGTNDAGAIRSAPEAERPALREEVGRDAAAFLRLIRAKNPGAYILWAYGMCHHELEDELRRAVQTVRDEGDARVGYASLTACARDELAAREHPGPAAHARAAREIARYLAQHNVK